MLMQAKTIDVFTAKRQLLGKFRIELMQLNDEDLLDSVLSFKRYDLNNEVPESNFPAWDIANRLRKNNYDMSKKQRDGLINTTSHHCANLVIERTMNMENGLVVNKQTA